ncbi:apolipoprotein N-acyltransferase [Malaciobacter pacificus]|jgi:apolipoprotein N-acyltransferase|uniref:Apolipoprotein N-acyltransferase n=1 Tax=Malaciobacter pacificus TaxID=1080223 RepID=A0A5C2H3N1_9BACT|nr:apolipoprotein N-acyltransferase [Malaciobacter pacificus]QEP33577.1 apolipoprotein N-acyltransferase [Malaciobacter pacificus]GGD39105.1 apolipoprotein N-acyltransferase [Malaciobacter pacificus]
MFLAKREHSNKNFIIKGLITAILFSSFIYLNYFGVEIKIIDTIFAISAFYLILTIPKKALFFTGFFIGVFWCYWMAVSLKYYELVYLTPILLIGVGLVYGIIFYLFALYDKALFRALALFGFSFLIPFGFNWIKPELLFINSYIGTSKIDLALILIGLFLIIKLKRLKIIGIVPLIFAISLPKGDFIDNPNLKIAMPQMNIQQNLKWEKDYREILIEKNFELIAKAVEENKDLIVLPETSFATALNLDAQTMERLNSFSYDIDIITGALYLEGEKIYNATYHISNGHVKIAKKVVLVPFGEEIPLPKFFVDLINDVFYGGASDYSKASTPTDFIVKDIKFRNAICYEATTDEIFKDLNDTKYMIATSNNAWFTPSIEPTLQSLLLKYYSKKYRVTIFHVVNGSKNEIFRP